MATEGTKPFPPMGFEEAVKFLESVNAHVDCPICGNQSWAIRARLESAGLKAHYPGLLGATEDGEAYLAVGFPVLTVSCENCGFMRLHDLESIRRRKQKPEQEDQTNE